MNTSEHESPLLHDNLESTEFTPEQFQELYKDLLEWCRENNIPQQEYTEPGPQGDPAVEHYSLPVLGEHVTELFKVPNELRQQNPRNFQVHLFTPRRFEEENELEPSIFVQYDFGPEEEMLGVYYLLDSKGGAYNQEELFTDDEYIESEERCLTFQDYGTIKAIIADIQAKHGAR